MMHACEKGASGIYRGHKCVARYFFRDVIHHLDEMKSHEKYICKTVEAIVEEEKQHKAYGESLIIKPNKVQGIIQKVAKAGAYTSKYLASKL